MKKVALLVALLVSVVAVPSVMARDLNWNALQKQWNEQQSQDQKDRAKWKALESDAKKALSGVAVVGPKPNVRSGTEPAGW
jgi:type II secretory pathway component PulK